MLRQGLRRCAPVRRTCLTAAPIATQCQARILLAKPIQSATVVPIFRNAFHHYRALRQEVAEAPVEESVQLEPAKPQERMRFKDLQGIHPNLLKSITDDMKYESLSEVQEKTIVAGLEGLDMVAQAKTGTGKTIAFLLPMLQRMIDEDPSLATRRGLRSARSSDIRGIVLSPTRELAEQIMVEAKKLVRHTGLKVQLAVGGKSKATMLRDMQREGCHLLVATPGRLLDLLSDPQSRVAAPDLDALVLDEADRMLDVGFADTLQDIQRALPDTTEKPRQTLLFSATIPKNVIGLAKNLVRRDQFQFVQTIRPDDSPTHEKVPQHVVVAETHHNLFPALWELMDREQAKIESTPGARPFKAIVYFRTTAMVELAKQLNDTVRRNRMTHRLPPYVYTIYGKLRQAQRDHAARCFRESESAILLSSDVTARGMDFPDVTHVIQVGLPPDREQYIHRLGRTGRQDKEGKGWLLITKTEAYDARAILTGLRVEQDLSIKSATKTGEEVDAPEVFKEIKSTFPRLDSEVLSGAYLSSFGQVKRSHVAEHLDSINQWVSNSWGWPKPPAVSSRWVERLGFKGVYGFNLGERRSSYRDDRDSGRNSGRDSNRGPRAASRDPFESKFDSVNDRDSGVPRWMEKRGPRPAQPWMNRGKLGERGRRSRDRNDFM